MTRSANDPAVIPASHCEAVLRGMSKRADKDGDWIQMVWQIHPNDVPQALWNADLRSRWQLAFVEIGENEEPLPPQARSDTTRPEKPKRPPATTRAEKARRLCGVRKFQDFLKGNARTSPEWELADNEYRYLTASRWVKERCIVMSRSELDKDIIAGKKWDALLAEYEQQAGRMAERHG